MTRYLLDTNIISEFRKGDRCNVGVRQWMTEIDSRALFLSVLVIGEIRQGIESIRRRDSAAANRLNRWLNRLKAGYHDQILPVTLEIAEEWGRINARRSYPVIDGFLAATARIHNLTLVTRNVQDIEDIDLDHLNPFV